MIDRSHDLPLVRQAERLRLSRWSAGQSPEQITDAESYQNRGQGLLLDHVAQARNLLLRLASSLIIKAFRLRLGVASYFAHPLLYASGHFTGGPASFAHCILHGSHH